MQHSNALLFGLSAAIVFFMSGTTHATSSSEVVPIGEGKYMITGRNATIFGSADGIAAKLMIKANEYCQGKSKSEAVLLDMSGESAQYGNNTASSTIFFKCGAAVSSAAKVEVSPLPESYYQRVDNLKIQLMSGDIIAGKGIIIVQAPQNFNQLPKSDAAMLEGRSTWWVGEDNKWFIHLQNVTTSTLAAFEFTVNAGSCADSSSLSEKFIIQLNRPIPPGEEAVVNFPKPVSTNSPHNRYCGIISSAWLSKH